MLEFAKKFIRQHWKGVTAVILALVALGLVIAFPEFVIYLGDLVLFGSTPFEFLSLMMLSEIPFFMGLASFFASAFAFLGVLAGSALFNFATYCYNYCYEKVKKFWEKHQTVAILLAALVVVGTIALMVLTQSWIIPVAMVVFHVAAKLMKWLDEKIINPKCDMIRLPAEVDPSANGEIPDNIKKQMRCERSYFLSNKVVYESQRVGKDGVLKFMPVVSKQNLTDDEDIKLANFIGAFPASTTESPKVMSALEPAIKDLKDWRASSRSSAMISIVGIRRETKHIEEPDERQSQLSSGSAQEPEQNSGISMLTRPGNEPLPLKAPTTSIFDANNANKANKANEANEEGGEDVARNRVPSLGTSQEELTL